MADPDAERSEGSATLKMLCGAFVGLDEREDSGGDGCDQGEDSGDPRVALTDDRRGGDGGSDGG